MVTYSQRDRRKTHKGAQWSQSLAARQKKQQRSLPKPASARTLSRTSSSGSELTEITHTPSNPSQPTQPLSQPATIHQIKSAFSAINIYDDDDDALAMSGGSGEDPG